MIDIERLLVAFLRADSNVDAIFDGSIYVDIPQDATRPVCRVQTLGGVPDSSAQPPWLNRPTVNVDVWADDKFDAFQGIAAIRTALLAAPREASVQTYGEVVHVSATFPAYLPDSDWPTTNGQPGPRYNMTTRLTAHPTRS